MTKEEFVHSIIKTLPGKYHENVVEKYVGSAFNELLSKKFWSYQTLDSLSKTYPVTLEAVTFDGVTPSNRLRASVAVPVISLPRPTDSVLNVSKTDSMGIDFAPVSEVSAKFFSYDNDADEPIGFWLGNGYVYFEVNDLLEIGDQVLLQQVVPFTEYDWTDEITIPGDMSATLKGMVKQLLAGKPVDEHYNDYKE